MTNIGAELARMKKDIERLQRAARLSYASLDDTALEVRDGTGSVRALVGQQGDGTTAVNIINGPVPPAPSAPVVAPALAALTVTWDGTFAAAVAAPLDWMRCEVHVGATPGFTPDQSTLRDTIETPQGGMVTIPLPYTEWYVKLRSRTSSGTASAATTAVSGTPRKAATADLTAGIITADLIAVDALTGKNITGGTVTGATLQTATSGQRVKVIPSNSVGIPAVQLYSGASTETAPGELVASVINTGHPRPYAALWAPTVAATNTSASLQLTSGGGASNDQGEWDLSTGNGSGGLTRFYAYASDGGPNPGQITATIYDPAGSGTTAELSLYGTVLDWTDANNQGFTYTSDPSFGPVGLHVAGDVTIGGITQGRGYAAFQARSTTTGTASTSTEPIALTQTGVVIKKGRAYRISVRGLAQNNTASTGVRIRVRKTNATGAIWLDTFTVTTPNAGANYQYNNENVVINDSGADITTTLVMTWTSVAGGNSTLNAGLGFYTAFEVVDIGSATNFSTAQSVT
ncbi:hypothetical protein ACFU98_29405 [Streptomyces sp. NPDC057575]|uniref:hypothetical protein n=1 Tax=unclassified Streptomyces TaxID=2593676 RepID=UPI0036B84E6C